MRTYTRKQKQELARKANEMGIFFEGQPAEIDEEAVGLRTGFVCSIAPDNYCQGEYSWETIERILNNNDGQFAA